MALGLTDSLSTGSQVEYCVLCRVFIYEHTRQPSPSGNKKHTPTPQTHVVILVLSSLLNRETPTGHERTVGPGRDETALTHNQALGFCDLTALLVQPSRAVG